MKTEEELSVAVKNGIRFCEKWLNADFPGGIRGYDFLRFSSREPGQKESQIRKNDLRLSKKHWQGSGILIIYFCQQLCSGHVDVNESDGIFVRYLSEK